MDMNEKVFSRKDYDTLIRILTEYGEGVVVVPTTWQIHLGSRTYATIEIKGPIGPAEWKELLTQLGRYKKWFKETANMTMTLEQAVDAIIKETRQTRGEGEPWR